MVAVARGFAQSLALIERAAFARTVRQHAAERAATGFGCWDYCVAMRFCPMGRAHALRESCDSLATALGKLVHLGVRRTPHPLDARLCQGPSTVAPVQDSLLSQVLARCQAVVSREAVPGPIRAPAADAGYHRHEPCAAGFDWARFQRAKGAAVCPIGLSSPKAMSRMSAWPRC